MNWLTRLFRDFNPRKVEKNEGITIESLVQIGEFLLQPIIENGALNPDKSRLYYKVQEKETELYELTGGETKKVLQDLARQSELYEEVKKMIGVKQNADKKFR